MSEYNSSLHDAKEKKLNILFVDDDIIELEIMDSVAEDLGQIAFLAKNREEAIGVIGENPIDIAFVDVNIEGDSGFEISEIIHSLNPDIKIIMKSGDENTFDEVKNRPYIMNFISKSQDIDKIEYYINTVFQQKMYG